MHIRFSHVSVLILISLQFILRLFYKTDKKGKGAKKKRDLKINK